MIAPIDVDGAIVDEFTDADVSSALVKQDPSLAQGLGFCLMSRKSSTPRWDACPANGVGRGLFVDHDLAQSCKAPKGNGALGFIDTVEG